MLLTAEGLVTDVTAVGSPDRAQRDTLGVVLDEFRPLLLPRSHFVM